MRNPLRAAAAEFFRQELIERLLDSDEVLRQTTWFRSINDRKRAAHWLKEHLHAEAPPDSEVIKMYFDQLPASPAESTAILEAVVNSHLEIKRDRRDAEILNRWNSLNDLKIKLERTTRELKDRQSQLMMQDRSEWFVATVRDPFGAMSDLMMDYKLRASRASLDDVKDQLECLPLSITAPRIGWLQPVKIERDRL